MSIEEREKEELGEISEDLMREHGEQYPKSADYYPGNVPADIASSAPLGSAPTVLADRSRGASVRSTFDTRPINGTDFHNVESQEVALNAEFTRVIADTSYTIPKSYVGVLREYEFIQYPILLDDSFTITLSVLVDGISQIGHSEIPIGQNSGVQKTHIIVPELSTVTIRVIYSGLLPTFTVESNVSMYGNLILTKNQPAAFEVGNPEPTREIPVPASLGGSGGIKAPIPEATAKQIRPYKGPFKRVKREIAKNVVNVPVDWRGKK